MVSSISTVSWVTTLSRVLHQGPYLTKFTREKWNFILQDATKKEEEKVKKERPFHVFSVLFITSVCISVQNNMTAYSHNYTTTPKPEKGRYNYMFQYIHRLTKFAKSLTVPVNSRNYCFTQVFHEFPKLSLDFGCFSPSETVVSWNYWNCQWFCECPKSVNLL